MKILATTPEVEQFVDAAYGGMFFTVGKAGTVHVAESRFRLNSADQSSAGPLWSTMDVLRAGCIAAGLWEHHSRLASHLLPTKGLDEETIARSLAAGGLKPYNLNGTRSITLQNLLSCKPYRADALAGRRPPPARLAAMIMEFRGLAIIHVERFFYGGYPLWHTRGYIEWTGAQTLTPIEDEAIASLTAGLGAGC